MRTVGARRPGNARQADAGQDERRPVDACPDQEGMDRERRSTGPACYSSLFRRPRRLRRYCGNAALAGSPGIITATRRSIFSTER